MYGLVPYNISPIQQGIQFGHAVQEYNNIYMDGAMSKENRDAFDQWRRHDKTFIILNGGTTNLNPESRGSLNEAEMHLSRIGIQTALFHEPDLGDQLTAVVFLVDERVYDKEKYPPYDEFVYDPIDERNYYFDLFGDDDNKILEMREFLSQFRLA